MKGNPTGEFKFDSRGFLKACELEGKYLGIWKDKKELSGNVSLTLKDLIVDVDEKEEPEK